MITKPLGTGVLVNAFKFDKLSAAALEPALREMERLNAEAARVALAHGATAATDVTGFGFAGHAANLARGSSVALRVRFAALPVHDDFFPLARRGVTTACTRGNAENVRDLLTLPDRLSDVERELLFDPQTSGGLLLALPAAEASACVADLLASGHRASEIGEILPGPPRLEIL